MSKITAVDLNESPAAVEAPVAPDPVPDVVVDTVEAVDNVAADIDTDELEGLLMDLKKSKKLNKAPVKKRTKKIKTTDPVVVDEPAVVAPAAVEPVVEPPKPKRQYNRKPPKVTDVQPQVVEPSIPEEEPTRRTPGNLIEEMQRAERALRCQMRKTKMQTLVTQAFSFNFNSFRIELE